MKKAFKSSTVQDQQVVSKNSIPNPVADIYNQSDKPPPLNILTPYRYGFMRAGTFPRDEGRAGQSWEQADALCGNVLDGSSGLKFRITSDFENNNCIIYNETTHWYIIIKVIVFQHSDTFNSRNVSSDFSF